MKWDTLAAYRPRFDRWYAWHPVDCEDGQTRWLEHVLRSTVWMTHWFEYTKTRAYWSVDEPAAARRGHHARVCGLFAIGASEISELVSTGAESHE
jgi:hypothetical protein